jgi:hypothetical protein
MTAVPAARAVMTPAGETDAAAEEEDHVKALFGAFDG